MTKHTSPNLLTVHKILSLQCHIAMARLNAISNLLFQSYPIATSRKFNTEPAADAIRNLKYTMENLMLGDFLQPERKALLNIYSGAKMASLCSSIGKTLHDQDNLDQHNLRIVDKNKKRRLNRTEHARIWIILQAIANTFAGYQGTFTLAYPSNDTPYKQAGEIVARVLILQEKIQALQIKENKQPIQDDEWQDIFGGLDHGCFCFEKALLVIQVGRDFQQEVTA